MKKALIAMSGGVDSSVAALLMKESGWACMGVTMKLYEADTACLTCRTNTCCSLEDVEDARSVAFRLDMPYRVFNFTADFEDQVIRPFVSAYESGITPNPCIDCNRYLKFDKLYRRARELAYDGVVTGHYARIEQHPDTGRYLLKKALDGAKDQSYVLYMLTQEQLRHTRFPLGGLRKEEVRHRAEAHGFLNARKPDSQDICFVPDGDYASFLRRYTGKDFPPGDFVDLQGRVLGRHRGIIHYTVGQRRGLGIAHETPLYVCAISPEQNLVTLGPREALFAPALLAGKLNLISEERLSAPLRCSVRIRYRQQEQPAVITQLDENTIRVEFDRPQRAVAPGQAVVFYDGDTVVGGATILSAII